MSAGIEGEASVSRAAQRLDYAQSNPTARVKQQRSLRHRSSTTTSAVQLTPAGATLLPRSLVGQPRYLRGNLVHFAAFKHHIGFYPAPSGIAAFQEALSRYKGAKGSVQFPLDQPLPLDLVGEIVRFRVAENLATAAAKAGKRRSTTLRSSKTQD